MRVPTSRPSLHELSAARRLRAALIALAATAGLTSTGCGGVWDKAEKAIDEYLIHMDYTDTKVSPSPVTAPTQTQPSTFTVMADGDVDGDVNVVYFAQDVRTKAWTHLGTAKYNYGADDSGPKKLPCLSQVVPDQPGLRAVSCGDQVAHVQAGPQRWRVEAWCCRPSLTTDVLIDEGVLGDSANDYTLESTHDFDIRID